MIKRFHISEFEARAQRLVEGSFGRLLGGELESLDVANLLAKALEDSREDGRVADIFTISLHPQDTARILAEQPDIEQTLADYVAQLARQSGWRLLARPYVTLAADANNSSHAVNVLAEHSQAVHPTTEFQSPRQEIDGAAQEILAALRAVDAYLIVDGERHVALDRPLIGLGRRMDNEVVLDTPTISRRHAQIRWRYGRFVLYDLSNRPGRTAVNGQPVQEYALQPGDVIALSTIKLIYGEGQDQPNGRHRADRAFVEEETRPRSGISMGS
ncbi:MAG: DUF3662 domain-containing protein [Chloroflexi bacterium]|nr:DUF3662 domain-containing protein [Chloroflexota bacterium]